MSDPKDETYSHKETVKRREEALKRMLNTPHKPHKPTGLTPSKTKKGAAKPKGKATPRP